MYKILENVKNKLAGNTKFTFPAPVILGPVPRILLQQSTNLVNKLALLLNKCRLREDSWDKPKNDWCRGRGFSAFCMFLKYHLPDAKASPSPARGEGMHRPWCNKILGTRSSMTGGRGANSFGRSMIEMLGVLAIIGVLSVGGIAGYSKAMEQFKINKIIQDYNMLIFWLMEHQQSFQESIAGEPNLTDTVMALNLVPNNWIRLNDAYLQDTYGNYVNIRYRQKGMSDEAHEGVIVDFIFGGLVTNDSGESSSDNFNEKICFEVFRNVAQPLHSSLKVAGLMGTKKYGESYFGDKFCSGELGCLHNVSLSELKDNCSHCDRTKRCNLTIIF